MECPYYRDCAFPDLTIDPLLTLTDALAEVVAEGIQRDERAVRYAEVMLGVDRDGHGPGASKTKAVATLAQRLDTAKAALAAYRQARP